MRAVFMGKNKRSVTRALGHLVDGPIEIAAVVPPPNDERGLDGAHLGDAARAHQLPVISERDLYAAIEDPSTRPDIELRGIDWVFSFLWPKKIKPSLIALPTSGCLNLHPAPLPEYRGWGAYIFGIYEGVSSWGVSAHFVDAEFDTGDLVRVDRFPIDPDTITGITLERMCQTPLFDLFRQLVDDIAAGRALPREPQGPGRTFSRTETEALRKIVPGDTPEQVARKVRAFFFPPYGGAVTEIDERRYYLVDEEMMREIGDRYHV